MNQYYLIQMRSNDYWQDDTKVIVNSIKELKEHIKQQIKYLTYDYPELNKTLKKRIQTQNMYRDPDHKIVGKVISVGKKGKLTDQDIEDFVDTNYISYWCSKIPKKDLHIFAGFKDINNGA